MSTIKLFLHGNERCVQGTSMTLRLGKDYDVTDKRGDDENPYFIFLSIKGGLTSRPVRGLAVCLGKRG